MKRVKVLSKKYDGSLRDDYETYLHQETDEIVLLFSLPGVKHWDSRKSAWLESQDGLIEIYFKHKWYNVWHIGEQISNTNHMYINIAMPATLLAQRVEWTDLDLDYRVHLDGSIERLDQEEFDHNRMRMGYPPQLIVQTQAACREVEAGLALGRFPFDYERQVELYKHLKIGLQA